MQTALEVLVGEAQDWQKCARAFEVWRIVAGSRWGMTAVEVARTLRFSTSRTLVHLRGLSRTGWVEREVNFIEGVGQVVRWRASPDRLLGVVDAQWSVLESARRIRSEL